MAKLFGDLKVTPARMLDILGTKGKPGKAGLAKPKTAFYNEGF